MKNRKEFLRLMQVVKEGNTEFIGSCQVYFLFALSLIQFRSVAQSCPTLCNPMDCSTPTYLNRPSLVTINLLVKSINHIVEIWILD